MALMNTRFHEATPWKELQYTPTLSADVRVKAAPNGSMDMKSPEWKFATRAARSVAKVALVALNVHRKGDSVRGIAIGNISCPS